jgi:hypothetical protein
VKSHGQRTICERLHVIPLEFFEAQPSDANLSPQIERQTEKNMAGPFATIWEWCCPYEILMADLPAYNWQKA